MHSKYAPHSAACRGQNGTQIPPVQSPLLAFGQGSVWVPEQLNGRPFTQIHEPGPGLHVVHGAPSPPQGVTMQFDGLGTHVFDGGYPPKIVASSSSAISTGSGALPGQPSVPAGPPHPRHPTRPRTRPR